VYEVEVDQELAELWYDEGVYEEAVEKLKSALSAHKDLIGQTPEGAKVYIITGDWTVVRISRNGDKLEVTGVSRIDGALLAYPPLAEVKYKAISERYGAIEEHYVIFRGKAHRVGNLEELRAVLSELRRELERAEVDPKVREEALRQIDRISRNVELDLVEYSASMLNWDAEFKLRDVVVPQLVYYFKNRVGEDALLKYAEHLRQRFTEREVAQAFKRSVEEYLRWEASAFDLPAAVEYFKGMQRLFGRLGINFDEIARSVGIRVKKVELPANRPKLSI